jgi:hypothetical protein
LVLQFFVVLQILKTYITITHQDMTALRSSQDVRTNYEAKALVIRGECTSQKKPREVEIRMKQVHELGWQRLKVIDSELIVN